jgi:hypothetical protein
MVLVASDLLGWWDWEDNDDDSTSNNNDMTLTGVDYVAGGKVNKGIEMGLNDLANVSITSGLSSSFTYGCWVKFSRVDITSFVLTHHVSSYNNYWSSLTMISRKMQSALYNGTQNPFCNGTTTINADTWYFVCLVRDVTNDRIEVWVNGTRENTATDTTTSVPSYGAFGHSEPRTTLDRPLYGIADCTFLANRVLTSTEIGELYNSGNGVSYPFSGYSKKINGVTGYSKINGVAASGISKVNGI